MTRTTKIVWLVLVVAALGAACGGDGDGGSSGGSDSANGRSADAPEPFDDPDLARGQEIFEANCAVCHGVDLQGTETGPPFLHEVYVPSHHGDIAFFMAAEQGVQPHHWEFGAMPPIPTVDRGDIQLIVDYIRQRQADAGFGG